MKSILNDKLQSYSDLIEKELQKYLNCEKTCKYKTIYDSVKYSTFAGGKRLRPILMMEFYRMCGGNTEDILPFACAIEMIHTYSLIHDDLPAMDNDDYRRGKLTNHKVFGDGMAVLAGDALLNCAFEVILSPKDYNKIPAEQVLHAAGYMANCSGMDGMIGGQVMDLNGEVQRLTLDDLYQMQILKTGKLIEAAVVMGCILAGREDEETLYHAKTYAINLGLAFQIQDDILDVEGNEILLGKHVGSDSENHKSTFPGMIGLDRCKEMVEELTKQAVLSLKYWKDYGFLQELTFYLSGRNH